MKKTLWMLGAAVAALTSCTESEVLDVPESKMIGFESFVDKPTRATNDVKNSTINSFYVYGTHGKKNGTFTREDGNGEFYLNGLKVYNGANGWTYAHKPWLANKTFRFAAYTDGVGAADPNSATAQNSNVSFIPNTTYDDTQASLEDTDINDFFSDTEYLDKLNLWGLKFEDYEVGNNTKDLVVAVPFEQTIQELTTAPGLVNLTFKHMLAKVQFEFIHGDEDNTAYLEIEPFDVPVRDNANLLVLFGTKNENGNNVTDPVIKWTVGTEERVLEFFPQENSVNQTWNSGSIVQEFYVIPQANDNINVDNITLHSLDSEGNITHTYTISNFNLALGSQLKWLPGYLYRYYATIQPNSHNIHFSVSVSDFIDPDYADQEIQ